MSIKAFTTMSGSFEIHGRIHLPAHYPAPGIICSHGLFSGKDSTKFISLSQQLAEQGFVVIRYDHRGCGESQGRIKSSTLTSRLEDLQAIYTFVSQQPAYIDGRLGLMGSSLGGLVSLWGAATNQAYHAVVTWATPWQIRRPRIQTAASGLMTLDDTFFTDLKQYRTCRILCELRRCLILHGGNDEVVPVAQAYHIYKNLAEPKSIEVFPDADHRFSNPNHRLQAIEHTAAFLRQHLM